MKHCTLTVKDEVWCYLTNLEKEHLKYLQDEFAIYVDGYFFMPTYKLGRWDGKIRFFEATGKTYVRLLDKIIPLLDSWGYDIDLIDNRKQWISPKIDDPVIEVDNNNIAINSINLDLLGNITLPNGEKFLLRPYQIQCIYECVNAGSGFIIAGTGAGKTAVTAGLSYLYSKAGYKTITIVPSSDLVDQTYTWYDLLKLDVGRYSGSYKDIEHLNVVATWEALQHNPSILQDFSTLIWDESHGLKAAVAQKLVNEYGKHIPFRFGVTGTFPKSEADKLSLHTAIGPIIKEIPANWLIEHKYLAKVSILPVELNEIFIEEDFPDYSSEKAFLSKNIDRMEMIANIIISKCANIGNTLVLVNSIPFGEKLSKLIKDSVFLYGESSKDVRQEYYKMFNDKDDLIVIASSGIASTGISIDRVFCLILVDTGKSFIKAIQSVGRGLRLANDKEEVQVVDIYSKQKWAKKHFKNRLKYYKEANYPVMKKEVLKIKGQ